MNRPALPFLAPIAALLVAATVTGGSLVSTHTTEMGAANASATASVTAEVAALDWSAAALDAQVSALEADVAAAGGRVLEPAALAGPASRVADHRNLVGSFTHSSDSASATVEANTVSGSPWFWDYDAASVQLAEVDLSDERAAAGSALASVAADRASISAAVAAWEAEQARIAAEKAEQERLARVAAEAAAAAKAAEVARAARPAASSVGSAAVAAPAAGSGYDVYVRTSVAVAGQENGQAAIDAGGQVAVIWPGIGTIVSAHNHNDARALSLRNGDIVRFTGAAAGAYRVTGSIDVPKGASADRLYALGTSMFMQTCYFGSNSMRIVGLVPA